MNRLRTLLISLVAVFAVAASAASAQTIVGIAASNPQFSTLVKAVQAAGLVDTLNGPGPFTVFAPTDAAFAKLPAGQLDALLADKQALVKVLTYRVVPGKVMASDVVVPSNPNASVLVQQLEGGHRSQSASDITMIRTWIQEGAQNN